jgi:hypothetical protein
MRYPVILFFITLILFAQDTFSQYYDTGQDPASLKWMQIKTDRFTVIFPEKYGSGGMAYAKSLNEAYLNLGSLFPESKFKIPVVIHNYTTQANGYVSWAPRRMELYPTPEQNTIPLSNEKQLTTHELAHVFQMESLNKGFSKNMSLIFGEQFVGITASLLPLWFLEGDAVFAESVLTESGRGRSPSFQKELKAITVEKGMLFNYDKVINGSFKDFVPDYYESGYQMVTWALAKYDFQIWNKALENTAKQPFTINPVNFSLRKSAGLTKKKLFTETFDSLKVIWSKDVSENNSLFYEPLNPAKKEKYINYYSPVFTGTDTLFAVKTSLSAPPAFVLINPSKKTEKEIFVPGQMYPLLISYANGKIVWVESQSDPRWENRNYSIIKLLDIKRNITTKISRKSRYLSASISPNGKKIAAIENRINNTNYLVLIDAETGTVLQSIPAPENIYLERPNWTEDGKKVTVIYLTEAGEGVLSFTYANQKWETLLEPGREDLQSASLKNDSLFFISSLSGTDNIYLLTPAGKRTLLTRSRFGTIDLCLYGRRIFFSDYTSLGNNICSTTFSEVLDSENIKAGLSSFLINRFNIKPHPPDIKSNIDYSPEPYRKWQHMFKFHSWMPFYADLEAIKADPTTVRPGISIMTQNILSTLVSSIGYEYSAEKKNVLHSRITWKGWYPVFESQLDYGTDPLIDKLSENVGNPSKTNAGARFSNIVSLPLRFSSGKFTEFLQPSFSLDYRNDYVYIKNEDTYDYGQTIFSGRLYFSNYYISALRDIYPKWAQTIDLNYSFAPFDKKVYGSAISLKSSFYFPGFLPNHSIKIRLEKEKQNPATYLLGNRVLFPRGYKNMYSKELELLSADYVLPLVYPDINVASILYLKRIRTDLFYDYGSGTGNYYYKNSSNGPIPDYYHNYWEPFRSFGFELMADFHVLRIPFLISGGVQTAWKKLNESPSFELLFNIDLFGMSVGKRAI